MLNIELLIKNDPTSIYTSIYLSSKMIANFSSGPISSYFIAVKINLLVIQCNILLKDFCLNEMNFVFFSFSEKSLSYVFHLCL